jgi:hypothetical protein
MSRRGKFLRKIRRLHRLRAGPGIVAIVSVCRRHNARSARTDYDYRREKKAKHCRHDAANYFRLQDSLRSLPRFRNARHKKRKAGG